MDAETSGAPVDDLQLQLADLAPPEAVSRHEQEHRVIATPESGRTVDRGEKARDRLPRERSRQALAPVDTWHVDLAVEVAGCLAAQSEEAEKRAELGNRVLQRLPAQALSA
jgi:hypothetical protein